MASNTANKCCICKENYNEEKCPCTLPCSHIICSECIQNVRDKGKRLCPFCAQQFMSNSARDMGVNFAHQNVLKPMRNKQKQALVPYRRSHASPSNWRVEFKRESAETDSKNIHRCRETKERICIAIEINNKMQSTLAQFNHLIENKIIVKLMNTMKENMKIRTWLEEQNNHLDNQKKGIDLTVKRMKAGIKKLRDLNASADTSCVSEVENIHSGVKTLLSTSEKQLSELRETHQMIEQVAKRAMSKIEILQEAMIISSKVARVIPEINIQDTMPHQITIELLRERKEPVMELIREGKVYAVQLFEGKQRYARISISRENRICLHYLDEKLIPTNGNFLQHSDVFSMVNPSARLTFLELSDAKKSILGKMYIRLTPDSKRATQFSILCTGEKGPNYTNTPVTNVPRKGTPHECVQFQNIDLLRGDGSRALEPGASEEYSSVFFRPWVKGSVSGLNIWPFLNRRQDGEAACFQIHCQNVCGASLNGWFGMVEEGLEVLTRAILTQPDIMEIHISDCGIVLPI